MSLKSLQIWVGGCALMVACATGERDTFDDAAKNAADPALPASSGGPNDMGIGGKDGDRHNTDPVVQPMGKTWFYAHTNDTLYRVDADDPTGKPEKLGAFDCIGTAAGVGSMTDLAIDEGGKLYGVSQKSIFMDMKVESDHVACSARHVDLSRDGQFVGASFAPKGVLDPNAEILVVADTSGTLFSVDTSNGTLTKVATLGTVPKDDGHGHTYDTKNRGKAWELSGDIVFLANAGKPVGFATVRDCPSPPSTSGCNETDTLLELDLSKLSTSSPGNATKSVRGMITKGVYCKDSTYAGYGSIYGLAAYQGILLGFARQRGTGNDTSSHALIVRIENKDGAACLVSDATSAVGAGWAGAGVTTVAPVTDPGPN